jgi:acyl-CoA synthetase (AMP-forming)/AMP-acid ligase II
MWNLYGPTEATIAFTAADVTVSPRLDGNASIGRPFGSNHTALLRNDMTVAEQPVVGDEGELLLGGPQVFAGYSSDAPSPFIAHGDTTYYRSGDLVRIDDEGVYFRGRVDSQVKFRGYRIELGEIETVARRKFGRKTIAVVVAGDGAEAKLVMYHLAAEDSDGSGIDLRLLEDTLPNYMIPTVSVALDVMPTNQNGKIDRRALASLARTD